MIPTSFLDQLVAEIDSDNVRAIALVGSHARGDATAYSDIDIKCFVRTLPPKVYTLLPRDGRLISLSSITLEESHASLRQPQSAIWAVPGFRQAKILLDKDGAVAQLQAEANAFQWQPLQPAADAFASDTMMGYAEEVTKIIGGLVKGSESTIFYGTLGLSHGMISAVAVQRGILITSENSYYEQVQATVGQVSTWTKYLRHATGLQPVSVKERGIAALHLYGETVALLRPIIQPQHFEVVEFALTAMQKSGFI